MHGKPHGYFSPIRSTHQVCLLDAQMIHELYGFIRMLVKSVRSLWFVRFQLTLEVVKKHLVPHLLKRFRQHVPAVCGCHDTIEKQNGLLSLWISPQLIEKLHSI